MKTNFTCGIAFIHKQSVLFINEIIPNIYHNDSFIITLADHLALELRIPPNNTPPEIIQYVQKDPNQDFMELWCDHLVALVYADKVYRDQTTCLMMEEIDEKYYNFLRSSTTFTHKQIKENITPQNMKNIVIKQILGLQNLSGSPNKILIVNFSGSVNRQDKLSAKINIQALYTGIFYQNGQSWSAYKILCGDIPTANKLAKADVLMLSGSSQSVYNNNPYVQQVAQNMRLALSINKKLKVMAICFGHQLIAKIYKIKSQRRQFVRGPQPITFFQEEFTSKIPYLQQIYNKKGKTVKMFQVHGDFVTSTPKGFVTIGSSPTCEIQSMVSLDKRIFTVQFHPEYSSEYWEMMMSRWNNINYKDQNFLTKPLDEQHYNSVKIIQATVRNFLNYKIEQ